MLFTDGLVERRDESIDDRLDATGDARREPIAPNGDAWCDRDVDAMIGAGATTTSRSSACASTASSHLSCAIGLPGGARSTEAVRDQVRDLARGCRMSTRTTSTRSLLAVGEAAANVAMHAYGAQRRAARAVHGSLEDGVVHMPRAMTKGTGGRHPTT